MYKIIFSVPVHESLKSILDLIDNYNYFNKDCAIVLHVSRNFKDKKVLIKHLPENVFINNYSIYSGRADGSQLIMHFLNFIYLINNNIKFEYFSLNASNEFFVRKGVYDYMKKYDAGFETDNVKNYLKWKIPRTAFKDPFLQKKIKEGIIKDIYYSISEGSFYKPEIFKFLIDNTYDRLVYDFTFPFKFSYKMYFNNKYFYHLLKILFPTKYYVTEEVYPPTFCILKSKSRGWPYCYFNTKHNSGFVTIDEINAIANNRIDLLPKYDRHQPGREFFTVKRVPRSDNNEIKKYIINNLMKNENSN